MYASVYGKLRWQDVLNGHQNTSAEPPNDV